MLSIEEKIQKVAVNNQWTLSVAESCTGGAIASRLTLQPGASQYFSGGVVSYSNETKVNLLHVSSSIIEVKGAVSEEVAVQMVLGVIHVTHSEFGLAVTGVAGPTGGSLEKPVGTVWIAAAKKGEIPTTLKLNLEGDRATIIECSATAALEFLLSLMNSRRLIPNSH